MAEGLLVVSACAGRVADDPGIQQDVASRRQTEVHELLATPKYSGSVKLSG